MLTDKFNKLKSNLELNDSFSELVQQRHGAVRSLLEHKDSNIETKLLGSLQRQTRIQPKANAPLDIDILVILGNGYRWVSNGITPSDAMKKVHQHVSESERYASMGPQEDSPTVAFEYSDGTRVELVPAYRDKIGHYSSGVSVPPSGRGYWVPKNGRWEHADYDYDAEYITASNKLSSGWIIPTIKMLKAIKREHFSSLDSFRLEVVAALVLPSYIKTRKENNGRVSYPDLISDFFSIAPRYVAERLRLPRSNSPVLEAPSDNVQIKSAMQNVANYIRNIDSTRSETQQSTAWREVFGEVFPAT